MNLRLGRQRILLRKRFMFEYSNQNLKKLVIIMNVACIHLVNMRPTDLKEHFRVFIYFFFL